MSNTKDKDEREEPEAQTRLPAVVPTNDPATAILEPPEKGTGLSEAARVAIDAGISAIPIVGGSLSVLGRSVLPSERDEETTKWRSDVTDAVNRNSQDVRDQKNATEAVQLEQKELRGAIEATAERFEQFSQSEPTGVSEPDPYDAEFAIYRKLIEQEKFSTAKDLLRALIVEAETGEPMPTKSAARATSLIAMCEKGLGNAAAAARLFFEAADLDPDNLRHRSNLVVAYLATDDPEAAERCLKELLKAEPNNAMQWANWVYVKSAQGVLVDLSEVPLKLRRTKDVCIARVIALRANHDPRWNEEAKRASLLHPESQILRRMAAESALERAAALNAEGDASPQDISASKEKAREAAEFLLTKWKEHKRTELYSVAPDVSLLQNTILGLRSIDRLFDAKALIDSDLDALLSDRNARAAVADIAMQLEDDVLLDLALMDRFPGDAPIRLERALNREQWSEALTIIELETENLDGRTLMPPEDMARILHVLLLPEPEQESAFEEALSEITEDTHSYLIVSRLADRIGANEIGDKSFDKALAQDLSGDRVIRFRLAAECLDRNQPEKAVTLLEAHVDTGVETKERRLLAMAYASTDVPVASGLEFFRSVLQAGNAGEETQRAGGHFHLNRRRPDDAIPWFRRALNNEPNKTRTQLALWQSLSRAGKKREAKRYLATINLDAAEGTFRDQMDICQVLWRSGRRDALDHAYEIAVRNQADVGVCNSYVGLILGDVFDSAAPPMPESTLVEPGSFVRLSRSDKGQLFEFVVVESDDEVPNHLSLDHVIAAGSLGKAVGDEFVTETGPNRFVWKVEEIKSKFLHLFHDLSNTLQDRFPEQTALWSVRINDGDFTPLVESLKARRAQVERVETLYRENPIPLACVASAGGGNAIDFAMYLAQSDQVMFSATGRPPDTEQEADHVQRAVENGVVVDTYTGWLLGRLNLLQPVRKLFKNVFIAASCADEFAVMLEDMSGYKDGRLSAMSDGDKIVSIHQTAEDLRAQIDDLKLVSDELTKACHVVGTEVPDALSPRLRELSGFLGTQFDTLSVAQREGCTVLSADLRLRQIAQGVFGNEAFGMDALLDYLMGEQVIDEEERAEALLTLATLRHSYIGLNAPTLLKMMEVDQTKGMARFERASGYFGRPDADIASHVTTAAAFVSSAFVDPRQRRKAERATSMILRNLFRFKGVQLKDIVAAFVRHAGDTEVTSYVVAWLRGHFLLDLYLTQVDEHRNPNSDKGN